MVEYEPVEVPITMTAMVKHLLKLNPTKFLKVTEYALFNFFVIVLKISRDLPLLDMYTDI